MAAFVCEFLVRQVAQEKAGRNHCVPAPWDCRAVRAVRPATKVSARVPESWMCVWMLGREKFNKKIKIKKKAMTRYFGTVAWTTRLNQVPPADDLTTPTGASSTRCRLLSRAKQKDRPSRRAIVKRRWNWVAKRWPCCVHGRIPTGFDTASSASGMCRGGPSCNPPSGQAG